MDFWKSIAGVMTVELTSAEMEIALEAIRQKGVVLTYLEQKGDLTYRFRIQRQDYAALEALCKKRGETLCVIERRGIYWIAGKMRKRPVLVVGVILLLAVILYLPTRIFFVRVEGNVELPDRRIIAAAEDCGICFGASRREVRSEKVKNALLAAVPELKWAGVNTSGCVAVISVREGAEQEKKDEEKRVTSIVAARDGYILEGTVTRGNGMFYTGQAVKEGQILISGYTDCGFCIQATRAEGEIMAQTSRELHAVTPAKCLARGDVLGVKRKYSLIFRKKRINLWKDSGISDTSCGRMYKEYYITLPGGFRLPLALCVEEYIFYQNEEKTIPEQEAAHKLSDFAQRMLMQQMVAGEIRNKAETTALQDDLFTLKGMYVCVEMIGREQQEQIGDTNGKSD